MLDLKLIEHNLEQVKHKLQKRGSIVELDQLIPLIKQRKDIISQLQTLQQKRNTESDALAKCSKDIIEQKRADLKKLSAEVKQQEQAASFLEEKIENLLLRIPNIPNDDVPLGINSEQNTLVRSWGVPKNFDFTPLHHVDIAEKHKIIDFERGVKVSGARFAFLRGMGAKLNRALMQYMLDYHTAKGDIELNPPYLVKAQTMQGVGQLPKFKDDVFCTLKDNNEELYLIPTAEAPVTNYFANEILEEADLPLRFCAYSPCFRSEAGAAGKDTRGYIRMHQFEKVEMVRFATSEQADFELEAMVKRAEYILQSLQLPYRVMLLCTGDLGACSQKTYDLEVWLPGQNAYREISSCSLFGDYQARRAKIRYRKTNQDSKANKNEYVVTLNGSGLPLGRTLVAIIENFQNKDGSIDIPEVLWPYMGGQKKIT